MTEPEVSSADPTQLQTLAKRDGDQYVINGHKWFTSSTWLARGRSAPSRRMPHGDPEACEDPQWEALNR